MGKLKKDTPQYRHELKFVCTLGMLHLLEHRLGSVMQLDPYSLDGSYIVNSLYFDDYHDSCCFQNQMGISERHKFRIRYYNNSPDPLLLEKKAKRDNLCLKTKSRVTPKSYENFCSGDVYDQLADAETPLLREFAIAVRANVYWPKVTIRYERTAFIHVQSDVRITLDANISVSSDVDLFLSPEQDARLFPVLDNGLHLLEVKYNDVLPSYIYETVQMGTLQQSTFSKYYMGRKAIRQYGGGIR